MAMLTVDELGTAGLDVATAGARTDAWSKTDAHRKNVFFFMPVRLRAKPEEPQGQQPAPRPQPEQAPRRKQQRRKQQSGEASVPVKRASPTRS